MFIYLNYIVKKKIMPKNNKGVSNSNTFVNYKRRNPWQYVKKSFTPVQERKSYYFFRCLNFKVNSPSSKISFYYFWKKKKKIILKLLTSLFLIYQKIINVGRNVNNLNLIIMYSSSERLYCQHEKVSGGTQRGNQRRLRTNDSQNATKKSRF